MIPGKSIYRFILLTALTGNIVSCKKASTTDPVPVPVARFSIKYADSVLYVKTGATDYIVNPLEAKAGTWSAFPDGLSIDPVTGAINVSKSETGLRYRITHISTTHDTTSALVVISGINYTDHFYRLSTGDSLATPMYNAVANSTLPTSGSLFDDGNGANSGGCSIKTDNAKINLAQCVRNGIFGNTPQNDVRKDFEIVYRLNDKSGKSQNKIKVRLFYYKTMADVAPDVLQLLQDRQQDGVFIDGRSTTGGRIQDRGKPRPSCIIILGN